MQRAQAGGDFETTTGHCNSAINSPDNDNENDNDDDDNDAAETTPIMTSADVHSESPPSRDLSRASTTATRYNGDDVATATLQIVTTDADSVSPPRTVVVTRHPRRVGVIRQENYVDYRRHVVDIDRGEGFYEGGRRGEGEGDWGVRRKEGGIEEAVGAMTVSLDVEEGDMGRCCGCIVRRSAINFFFLLLFIIIEDSNYRSTYF